MVGRVIGNYVLKRPIGKGGMGEVYLAEHPRMGKQVAIKILRPQHSTNQAIAKRFLNEARAATRIKSDHVVTIMDLGEEDDGTCYIIMELLEGYSLRDALRPGQLDIERAVHIGIGIARALAAAHAVGIVHRDLKPDNLFLVERNGDPDFVKVLDFGIAKILEPTGSASHHTQTGAILGTPAYMAPEQCRGAQAEIDARTDLYSFGIILYQMVTGRRPFEASDFLMLVYSHLNAEPRPPSRLNPAVPHVLETVILRALRKLRADRFQSAAEMAYALGASIGIPRERIGTLPTPLPIIPDPSHPSPAESTPVDTVHDTMSEALVSVTRGEPSAAKGARRVTPLAAAAVALLLVAIGIGMGVRRAQRSINDSPQPGVVNTAAVDASVATPAVAQQHADAAAPPPSPAPKPPAAVEIARKRPRPAPAAAEGEALPASPSHARSKKSGKKPDIDTEFPGD